MPTDITDEDARAKLRALEDRVGGIEGGVKEALELGKKAISTVPTASTALGAAWWNKLAAGSGSQAVLKIKSADGQDVSALITQLVDSAVSRINKDGIAKPDFALHSAGARVIPSLTSPAFELRPRGFGNQVLGLFTGKGYFGFRPPITALHHEAHSGHCWPFAGKQGQLGVMLVAPVYVEEITIDHIAKEVAFDMRSAPRTMEVWGMVEGKDNIERVKEWKTARAARKELGLEDEVAEIEYPSTLPKKPEYIRLARFTYDIHAPNNVQTFPVDPEIRDLGVDFGIVVLRVLDNWGRDDFTCLYRFRVHGQRMGEILLPYSPESSWEDDGTR
jgi:SUN domain-containing protein 1/2